MTDTTNAKRNRVAAGGRLERLVICYRWAWSWLGFWRGWCNEAKGAVLMAWMGIVGLVGATIQAAFVIVFPVWRLLIEPLKVGLTLDEWGATNLRKILDR